MLQTADLGTPDGVSCQGNNPPAHLFDLSMAIEEPSECSETLCNSDASIIWHDEPRSTYVIMLAIGGCGTPPA